eukprot:427045-Hanusia_phi.AAC.4
MVPLQVLGSALFAYIVGSISTVATSANNQDLKVAMAKFGFPRADVLQMKERVQIMQEYLVERKFPSEICERVRKHCMNKWKRTVTSPPARLVLTIWTEDLRRAVPPQRDPREDAIQLVEVRPQRPD